MSKQLLVPVLVKRVVNGELELVRCAGMLHDTNYARGAISHDEAARQWAEDYQKNGHNRWSVEYVMDVIPPFNAMLRLVQNYKSGNSAYLIFEDQDGNRWPMFLKDAVEFLTRANLTLGWSEVATFETIKRGNAYAIRMVPASEPSVPPSDHVQDYEVSHAPY